MGLSLLTFLWFCTAIENIVPGVLCRKFIMPTLKPR